MMKCKRCNDTGEILVAVENGAGHSIPCYDCQPLGESERTLDRTNQNVISAKKIWESISAKRKVESDLAGALLRIGTSMSHLCMKYGSVRGPVDAADRERMLDLDESWHQVTAELTRMNSKCKPFPTQAEIEAEDAEDDS